MDNVFTNLASAPAPAKRSRDLVEGDPSPGKRIKTNMLVEEERAREQQAALAAPPPSPTPHWSTALAKQQQRALEMMHSEAMDEEDIDMGGGGGGEDHLPSNPEHPWNAAGGQRMMHQLSTTSLSGASSSNDSSMPNTPLDLPFNEQWDPSSSATPKPIQLGYPSSNNPTSFTNLNGATVVFSTSPPLSVYPPPPVAMSTPAQHNPLHAAAGFPMHGWSASTSTSGVLRMQGPSTGADTMADDSIPQQSSSAPEVIRELNMPTYGWDLPRQSNSLNMGAHLV